MVDGNHTRASTAATRAANGLVRSTIASLAFSGIYVRADTIHRYLPHYAVPEPVIYAQITISDKQIPEYAQ